MLNLRPHLIFLAMALLSSTTAWSEEAQDTTSETTPTEAPATTAEDAPAEENAADATTPEQPANDEAAESETSGEAQEASTENAETAPATEPAPAEASPEPETPPEPAAAPAPPPAPEMDEPSASESATIAWVFAGVTLASLAGGAYAGMEAQTQFDCLSDIISCNEDRETPIENEDYLKAKADLDRLVLLADMGYLTAVITTTVTIAAVVKAMGGGEPDEAGTATSMLSLPQE